MLMQYICVIYFVTWRRRYTFKVIPRQNRHLNFCIKYIDKVFFSRLLLLLTRQRRRRRCAMQNICSTIGQMQKTCKSIKKEKKRVGLHTKKNSYVTFAARGYLFGIHVQISRDITRFFFSLSLYLYITLYTKFSRRSSSLSKIYNHFSLTHPRGSTLFAYIYDDNKYTLIATVALLPNNIIESVI